MKKKFYSHLIEIESLHAEIDTLDMQPQEKEHLKALASSNMHQVILDVVLSQLSPKDKEIFLQLVAEDQHEKVWEHLTQKVEGIEEKVKKVAKDLQIELKNDIKEAKK